MVGVLRGNPHRNRTWARSAGNGGENMIDKIEAWLKQIISAEVTVCRNDFQAVAKRLEADRLAIEMGFAEDLKKFEGLFGKSLQSIEDRMTERLGEMVATTLERFDAKAQLIEQTISKELDHWKTDEETRKADQELRHPKPTRR